MSSCTSPSSSFRSRSSFIKHGFCSVIDPSTVGQVVSILFHGRGDGRLQRPSGSVGFQKRKQSVGAIDCLPILPPPKFSATCPGLFVRVVLGVLILDHYCTQSSRCYLLAEHCLLSAAQQLEPSLVVSYGETPTCRLALKDLDYAGISKASEVTQPSGVAVFIANSQQKLSSAFIRTGITGKSIQHHSQYFKL